MKILVELTICIFPFNDIKRKKIEKEKEDDGWK